MEAQNQIDIIDILAEAPSNNEAEQGIATGKELEKLRALLAMSFRTSAEKRAASEKALADALAAGYRFAVASPDPGEFDTVFFETVPEKEQQRVANALIALCGGVTRGAEGKFYYTPEQSLLAFSKREGFGFSVQGNSKAARALRHERRLRAHAAFAAFSGNILAVFNVKPPKAEKALDDKTGAKRIAKILEQLAAGSVLKDKVARAVADSGFKDVLPTTKVNASKRH